MTIQHFHEVGAEADEQANEGRGKLALVPNGDVGPPLLRLACRDAVGRPADEQDMLAHIIDVITSGGYTFSRALVVVNRGRTPYDRRAAVRIEGGAGETLQALEKALALPRPRRA